MSCVTRMIPPNGTVNWCHAGTLRSAQQGRPAPSPLDIRRMCRTRTSYSVTTCLADFGIRTKDRGAAAHGALGAGQPADTPSLLSVPRVSKKRDAGALADEEGKLLPTSPESEPGGGREGDEAEAAPSASAGREPAEPAESWRVQRALAARFTAMQDPNYYLLSQVREEAAGSAGSRGRRAGTEAASEGAEADPAGEPPEPQGAEWDGTVAEVWARGRWLLGLLVLQSSSSFVLQANEALVRQHLVVTLFLTMLVGAGGNAGNQSAILVIRSLATNDIQTDFKSYRKIIRQQAAVGVVLGLALAVGGYLRVYTTNGGQLWDSLAIALSLFIIVVLSILIGTTLPFALSWAGQDPANAGTTVQVIMDVTGVVITCSICYVVLDKVATGEVALPF